MISLKRRVEQDELMDDPGIGFEEFAETLAQLEKINGLIASYRPTLQALEYFWKREHGASFRPLKILDVGCGYGDMLRAVRHWAAKKNISVELTGIDLNPHSETAASSATSPEMKIRYLTGNVFAFKPETKFHVVINSLFTHHLGSERIVEVMRWMSANAAYGWFINDLHRHPIPYHFIKYFVKIFGFNRLIKNDAPLSVARSFVRRDWEQLAAATGLDPAKFRIDWYWPFRYGVRYVA